MRPNAFTSGREGSVDAGQVLLRGASERQAGKHVGQAAIMRSRERGMNTLHFPWATHLRVAPYLIHSRCRHCFSLKMRKQRLSEVPHPAPSHTGGMRANTYRVLTICQALLQLFTHFDPFHPHNNPRGSVLVYIG